MGALTFLLGNWQYVAIALLAVAVGIQSSRLDSCKTGRAADQVAAQQREAALGVQIKVQNDAVAALKAEGDAKVAKASEGLRREATKAQAARSEAERLRTLAKAPVAATACPAGQAVEEVRKGLAK